MGKLRHLAVSVLQIFALPFFVSFAGALSRDPVMCSDIDEVQISYRNYWDIYLGDAMGTKNLKEEGIFVQILRKAIPSCCRDMNLTFISDKNLQADVEELVLREAAEEWAKPTRIYKFFFPEFADKKRRNVYDSQVEFVKLSQSPGHALSMLRPKEKEAVFVGEIFLKSWAIMTFLITSAWVIGILAWMTDHYKNKNQFPNPFYLGMFEGFWWSIVTMTTVGYGDKAPKSKFARTLAVVWIMTSTVFLSLFTANATSILAITQAEEDYSVTFGKRIGVLNSKHYVESSLNLGAWIVNFPSMLEMHMAALGGQIDRLVFPNYIDYLVFVNRPEYAAERNKFMLTKAIDHPFQIGMALGRDPGYLTDTGRGFLRCLRSTLPTLEKQMRGNTDLSTIRWHEISSMKGQLTPLNSDNLLTITYYILGIIVVLICLGLGWDAYMYYKKTHPTGQAAKGKPHENPGSIEATQETPLQEWTPTMKTWDIEAATKYKMSVSENTAPVSESYSHESYNFL